MKTLKFKYTTSRGRDSYGYNICSLWVDGEKTASTCGGGYDMKGKALGNWIARKFQNELLKFKEEFYGLKFYKQSSNLPTEKHTHATLDGACGFECMTAILKNIGYSLKYVDGTTNTTTYILT